MNITCHNCKTKLNIPDHKIPKGKDSAFKCPKCKETIQIPAVKQEKSVTEQVRKPFNQSYEERLNALICIDNENLNRQVSTIIQQMGLNIETVTNTKAALIKMEYHIYHLMVVDDAFDQNKGITGIVDRLNAIDMSLRRRICLVWINDEFNTNDGMVALHTSVNCVIHQEDVNHLEPILSRAMQEHKNFYTVYNESLKLAGRA